MPDGDFSVQGGMTDMKTGKMTAGIRKFKSMIGAVGKRLQYSIRNDPYISYFLRALHYDRYRKKRAIGH